MLVLRQDGTVMVILTWSRDISLLSCTMSMRYAKRAVCSLDVPQVVEQHRIHPLYDPC